MFDESPALRGRLPWNARDPGRWGRFVRFPQRIFHRVLFSDLPLSDEFQRGKHAEWQARVFVPLTRSPTEVGILADSENGP